MKISLKILLIGLLVMTASAAGAAPHVFVPLHWTIGTVSPPEGADVTVNGRTVTFYKKGSPDVNITATVAAGKYVINTYDNSDISINYTDTYYVAVVTGEDNYGTAPVEFKFTKGEGYKTVDLMLAVIAVPEVGTGTIQGTIRDNSSEDDPKAPIDGAEITLQDTDFSANSDGNGFYSIPDVPEGNYTMVVDAPEFGAPPLVVVEVKAGEITTQDFDLDPLEGEAQIFGYVQDADDPTKKLTDEYNAEVNINGETEMTNDKGWYQFTVSAGDYTIMEVTADDYIAGYKNQIIQVGPNEKLQLNFSLHKKVETGGIKGVVVDEDGEAIAAETPVLVTVTDQNDEEIFSDTVSIKMEAQQSVFEIETGITAGKPYTVTVSTEDLEGSVSDVDVEAGVITPLADIEMKVKPLEAGKGGIKGSVTDADGNAVDVATVSISGKGADTKQDGKYQILNIDPGVNDLKASKDGYESTLLPDVSIKKDLWQDQDIKLWSEDTLVAGKGGISGKIIDADSSSAVAGATVTMAGINGSGNIDTDENGEFLILNLDPGFYDVTVKEGAHEKTFVLNVPIQADTVTMKDIKLWSADDIASSKGGLTGTVIDAGTGLEIPAAMVFVDNQPEENVPVESDAEGKYKALDNKVGFGFAAAMKGTDYQYTLLLHSDILIQSDTFTVDDIELWPIDTLEQNKGGVTGKVLDPATGSAVEGATVTIAGKSVVTDQNGKYQILNLEINGSNTYKATVSKEDGYETTYFPNIPISAKAFTVQDINIWPDNTLQAGKGGFAGRIIDAETGLGLQGAAVTVSNAKADSSINGEYLVANINPSESCAITVLKDGYVGPSGLALEIKADTIFMHYMALNAETGGGVSGTVKDVEGNNLSGITIELLSGEEVIGTQTTGDDGAYGFKEVAPGDYTVRASHADYKTKTEAVSVGPGKTVTRDFELTLKTGFIKGAVKDADGNNLSGITIELLSGEEVIAAQTTGDDGAYELKEVAPADYTVSASHADYVTKTEAVSVGPGKTVTRDFELTLKTGILEGTVIDIDGNPIPDAVVEIIDDEGNVVDSTKVDENGNYSIEVPIDEYDIKISIPGYYEYIKEDYTVGAEKIELAPINLVKELKIDITALEEEKYLLGGEVGEQYSMTLGAEGGELPYTWSMVDGSLPKGLALNSKTGEIGGKPAEGAFGEFNFKIKLTDGKGRSDEKELSLIVKHYEPEPEMKIWFDNRLYQPTAQVKVEEEEKYVVSDKPDIKVDLSIEKGYALSQNITEDYSIVLNPGKADAKQLTLSISNVQPQSAVAAAAEGPSSFSIEFAGKDLPQGLTGSNVFKFTAKSGGSKFGIASAITIYATVEVTGGPLHIFGIPITYPSPFSVYRDGNVYIQYTLSADSDIEIYVIDVGGRRVKKFVCASGDEGGSAGLNKVKWEGGITAFGSPLANGIYVCTIIAKEEGRLLGKVKLTVVN